MKALMQKAIRSLEAACKGVEDFCSIRYWMGYKQALLDVNKKLKEEGLDGLED